MQGLSTVTRLVTRKTNLDESRLIEEQRSLAPGIGEVVLKIERFALSTNNITYAAYGETMGYWGFFPTGEAQWGHVPVWGIADVVASAVDGVETGERFYGYFPMASHLWVKPEKIGDRGFCDGAEHRQGLPSAYNHYTRCSTNPYYSPPTENLEILIKPLYLASAMLADFLQDNQFFGASQLVFSSASSKTAFGAASCLQDVKGVERIALTGERNLGFVAGLGCYEKAMSYEQLETLKNDRPTVYLDFSGDPALRERVHQHFGEQLVYSCFIGSAQSTQTEQMNVSVGPQPVFFFTPTQIRKRNAEWGAGEVDEYIGKGLKRFYLQLTRPPKALLTVVESQGLEAAGLLLSRLHQGQVSADEGQVVTL